MLRKYIFNAESAKKMHAEFAEKMPYCISLRFSAPSLRSLRLIAFLRNISQ